MDKLRHKIKKESSWRGVSMDKTCVVLKYGNQLLSINN